MKTRRDFLKLACAMTAAGRLLPAQTANDYKALVCVFLFGGNDGNNTVVPMDAAAYAAYAKGRSSVALPIGNLAAFSAQGQAFGLHPQLAGLRDLYMQKRMAVVANTGMLVAPLTRNQYRQGLAAAPKNLYSHSDQTLEWQSGNPIGGGATGWGGRAIDVLGAASDGAFPPAVSVAGNSLLLTGSRTIPANLSPGNEFGLESIGGGAADTARLDSLQEILTMDTGAKLVTAAGSILQRGFDNAKQVRGALAGAKPIQAVFPNTSLGSQMKQIAQIIAIRSQIGATRQVFFSSQGGYDHHSELLTGQDRRFAELGPALVAFYRATEELGVATQVTTFSASEFGRTFNPSSTDGSDHAWGSHHFVVGGAVKGGTMYGRFPTLEVQGPDDANDRGTWIPTTSLDQYGATMASWFGVSENNLATVFPNLGNFATKSLQFV